jgi:hypothetical protein
VWGRSGGEGWGARGGAGGGGGGGGGGLQQARALMFVEDT